MNVVLPPELERYVESLVRKGHYPASSEVIAEALRQHQLHRPGLSVVMTPELEKVLDEGMAAVHEASTTDELRQRRTDTARNQ